MTKSKEGARKARDALTREQLQKEYEEDTKGLARLGQIFNLVPLGVSLGQSAFNLGGKFIARRAAKNASRDSALKALGLQPGRKYSKGTVKRAFTRQSKKLWREGTRKGLSDDAKKRPIEILKSIRDSLL